jgi:peptidoglycan/LPS O-acetylase OafA/YrhL
MIEILGTKSPQDAGDVVAAKPEPKSGYMPQLDGLRALAVGLVVLTHITHSLSHAQGGWIGVDVFFVLSGFLITTLLVNEASARQDGKFSMGRFYLRRVFRLWPAYVAFILGTLVYARLFQTAQFTAWRHQLWIGATYRMNFWEISHVSVAGVGQIWTLCMEEQFYLLWPVVLLLLGRRLSRNALIGVTAALMLASVTENIVLAANHVAWSRLYYAPDTNAYSLLLGCLFALIYTAGYFDRLATTRFVRWFPFAFIGILIIWTKDVSATNDWVYAGPVELVCLAAALGIIGLIQAPNTLLGRALSLRFIVWIGVLSYSIYLWNEIALSVGSTGHGSIVDQLAHFAPKLFFLAALPLASYYLVERPGLKLKKQFEVRRSEKLQRLETATA